jgi:hypothetical protein
MHTYIHTYRHPYLHIYIHIAKTAADAAVASTKLKKEQNAMSAILSAEAAARVREAEDGARVAREVC